jgi:hypothetical protein
VTTGILGSVLAAGVDDWVPLRAIDGLASRRNPTADDIELRRIAVDTIRELLANDLVEIGDVSDGGFFRWEGSSDDWLRRIERVYESLGLDERSFAVWINNTEAGDEVGRQVLSRDPSAS